MEVRKFPLLPYKGKFLQWDSRQSHANAQIVIRKGLSDEFASELKKKGPAIIEGKDFKSWGGLLAEVLGNPSEKLRILGVVGTNGKTTTAALLRHVLSSLGYKVLEIGTLGAALYSKNPHQAEWHETTGFTSPEAHTLQDLLAQAVKENVDFVVMEVTSHAIALERIAGIEFDGACFLNFSQDHLDFHKTLAEYQKVKESFFLEFLPKQKKKNAITTFNVHDPVGKKLFGIAPTTKFSFERAKDYEAAATDSGLKINIAQESFTVPLLGDFQENNIIPAALLLSKVLSQPVEQILSRMQDFRPPPGRMERVEIRVGSQKKIFIVDFAHTPDALEKSLKAIKKICTKKLWVVFGCGGDRDPLKRPMMGKIAGELADEILVTSDNPRSENPESIIRQIVEPLEKSHIAFKIFVNRKDAIRYAVENLAEKDVCLVAGRGHEEFQVLADKKIPFRDADIIRDFASDKTF